MQASKSRDTMDTSPNASIDDGEIESGDADSVSGELENQMVTEQPNNKRSKPSSKSYQLKRCSDVLTALAPEVTKFALFVDEKLKGFNKRSRMMAEKKISDIIYEIAQWHS